MKVYDNHYGDINQQQIGGSFISVFSGITFKQEESIAEIGDVEITREKEREINWPQWAGVAVVAAGVVIFLVGRKR